MSSSFGERSEFFNLERDSEFFFWRESSEFSFWREGESSSFGERETSSSLERPRVSSSFGERDLRVLLVGERERVLCFWEGGSWFFFWREGELVLLLERERES